MSEKRQQVLETALSLFGAHGYHAIGIDRVIAESGVAKMTLYKYFPSKNALIAAVLTERDLRFRRSLNEFVDAVEDPKEKLRAVFLWHHCWQKEASFHGCLFINAVAEFPESPESAEFPETNSLIRQASIKHKALVQDFIASILRHVLSTEISQRLSAQLSQLLDGATIAAQISANGTAAFLAWHSAVGLLGREGVQIDLGKAFESAKKDDVA